MSPPVDRYGFPASEADGLFLNRFTQKVGTLFLQQRFTSKWRAQLAFILCGTEIFSVAPISLPTTFPPPPRVKGESLEEARTRIFFQRPEEIEQGRPARALTSRKVSSGVGLLSNLQENKGGLGLFVTRDGRRAYKSID